MATKNCIIDTCIFAELLKQYDFGYPNTQIRVSGLVSHSIAKEINKCIEYEGSNGYVIISVFAIVEIVNKFNEIFNGTNFTIDNLFNFIEQQPSWLLIENFDKAVVLHLLDVPCKNLAGESISSDDAIHIATAINRGEPVNFCTSDGKLIRLNIDNITFID